MTKLTKEELDRRTSHMVDLAGKDEKWKNLLPLEIKQLIRDCIEAVTPRTQPGEGRQALLHPHEWYAGHNQAIDTIQKNLEELIG